MSYLALSFEVGSIDPEQAETTCVEIGALSVTFSDEQDDPVLEPLPGEVRLWPHTRLTALFAADKADAGLIVRLATALGLPLERLQAQSVADRAWEREWLRDFHAMRFGRRLWVSPRHETVQSPLRQFFRMTRTVGLGGPCSPWGPGGPTGPTGPGEPAGPGSPFAPGCPAGPGSPFSGWPHPASPTNSNPTRIKCPERIFATCCLGQAAPHMNGRSTLTRIPNFAGRSRAPSSFPANPVEVAAQRRNAI